MCRIEKPSNPSVITVNIPRHYVSPDGLSVQLCRTNKRTLLKDESGLKEFRNRLFCLCEFFILKIKHKEFEGFIVYELNGLDFWFCDQVNRTDSSTDSEEQLFFHMDSIACFKGCVQ